MVKRQVMFTFPQELIREPIIYNLSQQFKVVTNIRRADISEDKGWVVLELQGEEKDIEQAVHVLNILEPRRFKRSIGNLPGTWKSFVERSLQEAWDLFPLHRRLLERFNVTPQR